MNKPEALIYGRISTEEGQKKLDQVLWDVENCVNLERFLEAQPVQIDEREVITKAANKVFNEPIVKEVIRELSDK